MGIIMKTIEKKKSKKGLKTAGMVIGILLAVIIIAEAISCSWQSNPANIKKYKTSNPYIVQEDTPQVSAHRSGGGINPEETMMAFRNCAESTDFSIDIFEFDLHITKDNVLVLLHDDTLDRTSDCVEVFGREDVRPEELTYEELRTLNMGAKFEDENGNTPYADLNGEAVPDELRILRIEDVLDYLVSVDSKFDYIIEIKNSGELGMQGVDILYGILTEKNLLNDVIFGTFHEEVSHYVDDNYPDMKRSATIKEVLSFYTAALTDDKNFEANYAALQIPFNMPYRLIGNLGTAKVINYAHSHDIAVQYWTVNSEKDLRYLSTVGADCIMTDYPDLMYKTIHAE